MKTYRFNSKVVLWQGAAAWHFAYLEHAVAQKIRKGQEGKPRIGWGSVPVTATIGKTTWKSSIFPDKKSGTYLLPLKAEVRKAEGIASGDMVTITIVIAT